MTVLCTFMYYILASLKKLRLKLSQLGEWRCERTA